MSYLLSLTSAQLNRATAIKDEIRSLENEQTSILGRFVGATFKLEKAQYEQIRKGKNRSCSKGALGKVPCRKILEINGASFSELKRCQIWHVCPPWSGHSCRLFCVYMKKLYNMTKPHRSVRRLAKQFFTSLIKQQSCSCSAQIKIVMETLMEIEKSIEIIAREIARQIRSRQ